MTVTVTGGIVPMIGARVTVTGGIGKRTKSGGKPSEKPSEKPKENGGKPSGKQRRKNGKPEKKSGNRMTTTMIKMTTMTRMTTGMMIVARKAASTEVKGSTES